MKLQRLHEKDDLLQAATALISGLVLENKRDLPWPRKWADDAFSNRAFQAWLESLGVSGKVSEPMQGGVGRAYPVGKSHIVKFTMDHREAQAAAVMVGHDSRHAASILGVRRISQHDRGDRIASLFAIVMEKLNVGVGWRMRAAGNAVYKYLDDHSGFIEDVEATIRVVLAKYVDKDVKNDPGMQFSVRKIVSALHDVQEKTGVLSQDPHGGNVAFKGREPAFFDFGRSSINLDNPKTHGTRISSLDR